MSAPRPLFFSLMLFTLLGFSTKDVLAQPDEAADPVTTESESGSLHGLLSSTESRYAAELSDDARGLNQDAMYARPFVASFGTSRTKTALGGYLEANSNYFVEDGVSEGFSFEFRRFNLFVYTSIAEKIKFFSELEFEHGTEEIALETAQLDLAIDPMIGIKAGIILPPIGRFNVNHDAPIYQFVERPLVSEHIVPSTLSEVGAGIYGKFFPGNISLTYDFYVVNGLQGGVVANSDQRTYIPAGKSEEMFAEDNNGRPSYTARFALAHETLGELGLSYYGGVYNRFRLEGEVVDDKRKVHLAAIDLDTAIYDLEIQGEAVFAAIDLPPSLVELFGHRQNGFYLDLVHPVYSFSWLKDAASVMSVAARVDRIDFNYGNFRTGPANGNKIFDEETSLALGLSLRPVPDTILRVNYRRHWIRDLLGNPAAIKSGIQFGVATYF